MGDVSKFLKKHRLRACDIEFTEVGQSNLIGAALVGLTD